MKTVIKKLSLIVFVVTLLVGTAFAADNTAPKISWSEKDGSTLEAGSTFFMTITDDTAVSEVNCHWKGGSEKKYSPYAREFELELNIGTQNGKYVFYVTAIDAEGNSTGEQSVTYYVNEPEEDNDAPVIKLSERDGATLPGGTKIEVTFSDANNINEVTYYWEGSPKNTAYPKNPNVLLKQYLGTQAGEHVLRVSATDNAGNSTGEQSYTFYVESDDNEAPEISVSEKNGSTLMAGQEIDFCIEDESKISKVIYNWAGSKETTLTPNKNGLDLTVNVGVQGGRYVFYLTAIDSEGNSTEKQTYTFYVEAEDEDAPEISVSEANGSTLEPGQEVVVRFSDVNKVAKVVYNWAGMSQKIVNPYTNDFDLNLNVGTQGGKYVLYVTAIDSEGNSSDKMTYTFYVEAEDEEAPVITVTPANGSTLPALTKILVNVSDEDSKITKLNYQWVGSELKEKVPNKNEIDLELNLGIQPGKYLLKVEAIDEKDNVNNETFTFYVEGAEDNENPTVSVSPSNGSTIEPEDTIIATPKDNEELSKIEYYWDDEDPEEEDITGTEDKVNIEAPEEEGKHILHVKVTDEAGNTTDWKEYVYYVEEDEVDDDEDPEVFADPDGGDVEYGDRITVWAEDDNEIEFIEYYWDDEDDDTITRYKDEFTVKVPSEEGKHYLYVRAQDEAGNMCGWEKFIYNIEENNYPGNPDITGEINKNVKVLRVEIRNADDKIKFEPEEEITYFVDYYNGSSSKVNNAKLEVELPTYLEAKKASDDGKITTKKVTWSLGTLKAGDYGRVSFKAEYTKDDYNEKIITVPAKIYAGSTLKDTSTVRNMIYSDDGTGTGHHSAYCIGYPDGSFRPNGNITRAELASMVANMEGIRTTYKGQLYDVPREHWAASAIQACVDNGYVLTVGFNGFAPEQAATRGELAYAIAAILGVEDLEPIFINSTDLVNSDFRCAMEQLLRLGIMDGYSNGTARPNASITRAEAVTIINSYLFRGELIVSNYGYGNTYNFETGYNYGGNGRVLSFTDLSTSHWAYGHIMEATNNHSYERVLDGNEKML